MLACVFGCFPRAQTWQHLKLRPNLKTQKVTAIKRSVARLTRLITDRSEGGVRGVGLAARHYDAFAPPGSRCGGNESSTAAATRRQRPLQLLRHLAESFAAAVSLFLAAVAALLTLMEVAPLGRPHLC